MSASLTTAAGTARPVAAFFSGDYRFLLVKDSVLTGTIGICFLVSTAVGRPLTLAAAQGWGEGRSGPLVGDYDTNPLVRRGHRVCSLAWGSGLLAEALIRMVRIPIEHLARHRLVRYSGATRWINSSSGEDVPTEPPAHEFEPTDPQTYRETTDVPLAHLEYLTECQAAGKQPLGFVHVPHVLALGPIDISDVHPTDVG